MSRAGAVRNGLQSMATHKLLWMDDCHTIKVPHNGCTCMHPRI